MDKILSRLPGFRALLSVGIVACALGAPSAMKSGSRGCPSSLATAALTLKATGIESSSAWALISLNNEDLLVDEGESIGRCLRLTRVRNGSVVVTSVQTEEGREFFFSGFSSVPAPEKESTVTPGDGFIRAVSDYKMVPVSGNILRVEYPAYSNNNTLPQTVYRNARGDAFYSDVDEIGIGGNSQPEDRSSAVEGIRIGENSQDSLLGSLGIGEGDHLVAINGYFVNSPEQVGTLLKKFAGETIQIGYTRGDNPAIYSTATMVQGG